MLLLRLLMLRPPLRLPPSRWPLLCLRLSRRLLLRQLPPLLPLHPQCVFPVRASWLPNALLSLPCQPRQLHLLRPPLPLRLPLWHRRL